jgi:glycosyltransferase involved in cell wall biosynthesis
LRERELHILFVNPGLHLGGAEHSLLLLVDGLRARGITATVALFGPGAFQDRLTASGIPTVTLRAHRAVRKATRYRTSWALLHTTALAGLSLATALDLALVARRAGVDLIHTNGLKAHLIGGIAGRLIGVPVIWHVRDFPPRGRAGALIERGARVLPSRVLANSDTVAAAIGGDRGVRVTRIYNPIDLVAFRPDRPRDPVRAELGVDRDTPVVGLVAHLTPWKGHEAFLQIARRVADRVPSSRFVVAGGSIYETDGHTGYREALVNQADALGLGGRLTFLGSRTDMPDVMAALDVLVHCPEAPEPFGRGVAEAMASGRPVVVARSGGLSEVVEDGVTGLLVPPGDVDAFASAIIRLLDEPSLRRQFGTAGRERAERLFDAALHTRQVVATYADELSAPWLNP